MITIRPATEKDVHRIMEIYNEAILNTTATFDTDIKSMDDRLKWFSEHGGIHPVIVAVQDEHVVGYACLSKWSERCAYDGTVEVSVYVDADFRSQGIGKKLLEVIVLEGKKQGLHNLISRITEGNESSIHIHETLGFTHIGVMRDAGKKFGKFLDVHFMQKVIGSDQ
jgi:L-amino acid N-acyltransferase